jgi:hypothetical protein
MTTKLPRKPTLTRQAEAARAARLARSAAALRQNLRRRKAALTTPPAKDSDSTRG